MTSGLEQKLMNSKRERQASQAMVILEQSIPGGENGTDYGMQYRDVTLRNAISTYIYMC